MERPLVYILDDELMVGKFVEKAISQEADVQVFTEEQECLEILKVKPPDFLIIDYYLNKMTGLEFYDLTSSYLDSTEVIFLSGQNDLTIVYQIINKKIGKYVIKGEDMIECITCLLVGDLERYEELL